MTLSVSRPTSSQRSTRTWKTLTVRARVLRSDTGGPLAAGQLRCAARFSDRPIPVFEKGLARGIATCVWRVSPQNAGRKVNGSISVGYSGAGASATFSLRVR